MHIEKCLLTQVVFWSFGSFCIYATFPVLSFSHIYLYVLQSFFVHMYMVRMKWINLFGVIWCENTPLVFWTCLSSPSYFQIANFSVIYQILVMSVSVLLLSTLFVLGYQIRALNLFKLKHEEVLIFTWCRYKFIPSEHIACKYPFMAD